MTELPVDGELQLGQIRLPAGKRFHAGFGPARRPVAWVTREAVPQAGGIWAALHDARQETGRMPFLAGHLRGEPTRPFVESDPGRARHVSGQFSCVLLELVLSAIVLGEPAADLRAELVRFSSPPDQPAPPDGLIEHSILGLRSG